jgi:hypothetical protein
MATRTLTEKIEALPPDKRAEVENFVNFLESRASARRPPAVAQDQDPLLREIQEIRSQLLEEHGPFDTSKILRELREFGD